MLVCSCSWVEYKGLIRGVRAKMVQVYIRKEALRPFSLSPLDIYFLAIELAFIATRLSVCLRCESTQVQISVKD